MTKLKTLKDFIQVKEVVVDNFGAKEQQRLINIKKLKAEAVKDIKAIHQGKLVPDDVEEYIRWKFNLEEEDLK